MTKRIIWTGITILWMVVIFSFSAKPAVQSTEMSTSVGKMICRIFVHDFSSWSEEKQEELAAKIDHPVRKCAHASEYALLGALVLLTACTYAKMSPKTVAAAVIISVLYAASDEFHQRFVPGRSCQFTDVLIDSAGVMVGVGFIIVCYKIKQIIKSGGKDA